MAFFVQDQPQQPEDEAEETQNVTPVKPSVSDRSAYNCPVCKGEGLQDSYTLCPRCGGTGKV